jgi:hypothetical protein
MTKLWPDLSVVGRSDLGETSQERHVDAGSENEISRLFRITMVDLHLTDERHG